MRRYTRFLIVLLTLSAWIVVPTGLASIPTDQAKMNDATAPDSGFGHDVFQAEDGAIETTAPILAFQVWADTGQDGGGAPDAATASVLENWIDVDGDGAFGRSIFDVPAAPAGMTLSGQGDVLWMTTDSDGGARTFGSDVFALSEDAVETASYVNDWAFWSIVNLDGGGFGLDLFAAPSDVEDTSSSSTNAAGRSWRASASYGG